jgi:acetyl-CoA carboxylase carboxyl transferase subunit beta
VTIVFAVSAAVFDAAGRILLVERARPPNAGKWSLPGGRAEPGERRTEAVVREVREETGIAVEVGELVAETQVRHGDVEYSITTYLARPIGGVLAAASDARAAGFVTADELARLPLTDGLLPVIEKARAMQLQWW